MKSEVKLRLLGASAAALTALAAVRPWAAVPAVICVVASASAGLHFARESLHDPLTGLFNRRALEEFRRSLPGQAEISLLYLDADDLHSYNLRLGHSAGDRLLCAVARDLGAVPGAEAFRIGGDEFLLVSRSASASGLLARWSAAERAGCVSAGSASGKACDWMQLIQTAEKSMYDQKNRK